MYLNDFSVRIPEGNETPGGYVELAHRQRYTLVLRNSHSRRCDARVEIDGKHVGTWRIDTHGSIRLERPVHDTGHFTFYKAGTPEAARVELNECSPDLGLVKVTFTPAKPGPCPPPAGTVYWTSTCSSPDMGTYYCAHEVLGDKPSIRRFGLASSGGTGLSGESGQRFCTTWVIDYDYSMQTTIHLRLVCRDTEEPRPLTSYSTPVPPPVR